MKFEPMPDSWRRGLIALAKDWNEIDESLRVHYINDINWLRNLVDEDDLEFLNSLFPE